MRALGLVVLGLLCTFGASGCGKKVENQDGASGATTASGAKPNGNIALVDLDAVARNLGRMSEMEKDQQAFQNAVVEQLQLHVNEFNKQLADRKFLIGDKPNDDQQKDLAVFAGNLQGKFEGLKQQAGTKIQMHQNEIVSKFQEDVKGPVREVAKELGLSAVFHKNNGGIFLVVDDAIDITDAVTAKMKAAGGSEKPAETKTEEEKPAEK